MNLNIYVKLELKDFITAVDRLKPHDKIIVLATVLKEIKIDFEQFYKELTQEQILNLEKWLENNLKQLIELKKKR